MKKVVQVCRETIIWVSLPQTTFGLIDIRVLDLKLRETGYMLEYGAVRCTQLNIAKIGSILKPQIYSYYLLRGRAFFSGWIFSQRSVQTTGVTPNKVLQRCFITAALSPLGRPIICRPVARKIDRPWLIIRSCGKVAICAYIRQGDSSFKMPEGNTKRQLYRSSETNNIVTSHYIFSKTQNYKECSVL